MHALHPRPNYARLPRRTRTYIFFSNRERQRENSARWFGYVYRDAVPRAPETFIEYEISNAFTRVIDIRMSHADATRTLFINTWRTSGRTSRGSRTAKRLGWVFFRFSFFPVFIYYRAVSDAGLMNKHHGRREESFYSRTKIISKKCARKHSRWISIESATASYSLCRSIVVKNAKRN